MTFTVTKPTAVNDYKISTDTEAKTVTVEVANGIESVEITATVEKGTTIASNNNSSVTVADNKITVNTKGVAESGGKVEFTLTITSASDVKVVYNVSVTVAAKAAKP